MTILTAALIIIGFILIIGSFFITEKMSAEEVDKLAKLNMDEINHVMDNEIAKASEKAKEELSVSLEDVMLSSERSMEKTSNEKIMAISDYSDTVLESMDKTHNEIMFLYSMLNDKHKELTDFAGELADLQAKLIRTMDAAEREQTEAETKKVIEDTPEMPAAEEILKESVDANVENENGNHNEKILELYNRGEDEINIAKKLGLGYGEVKLVIDLYKEKKD